jgi:hypothetical protein
LSPDPYPFLIRVRIGSDSFRVSFSWSAPTVDEAAATKLAVDEAAATKLAVDEAAAAKLAVDEAAAAKLWATRTLISLTKPAFR